MQGKRYKNMNIKAIREKAMLTQDEFAKLVGVSRWTVFKWENRLCDISEKNMEKIKELKNNTKICQK